MPLKTEGTPQFQFVIMIPRDEFSDAKNILGRNKIKPHHEWNDGEMSFLAFYDTIGIYNRFDHNDVIKILDDAGISSSYISGADYDEDAISGGFSVQPEIVDDSGRLEQ